MPKRSGLRSGQIILIMSITLIIVILGISAAIYLTSTQQLFFDYNPSREIILSIDSDFRRVLTRILANATGMYNKTAEIDEPRRFANMMFSYWFISTQAAYTGKGLNIGTQFIDEPIREAKNMTLCIYNLTRDGKTDKPNYYEFEYSEMRLQNKLFKLFWYRPNSISAIGASLSADATAKGIIGWMSKSVILLNLTITSIIPDEKEGFLYVDVTVLKENGAPVNDLSIRNFEIYLVDPTVPPWVYCWERMPVNSMNLTYNGGGNYTIRIKPTFYDTSDSDKVRLFWRWESKHGSQPHQPGYYQFVLVRVQDNRGIIVESYTYSGIDYAIWENAVEQFYPNDPSKVKETYVFELIPNGTMYWYNNKLPSSVHNPPIPLPPVKQVRVLATVKWPTNPTFVEVPYQTEIWNDKYLWPNTDEFLDWKNRIMHGSKLVFELNYPPGCNLQKVRLTWLEDCDATPPEYRLQMVVDEVNATVDTGSYILTLVARMSTSYWVDWSISLMDPKSRTHVEYLLLGYDVYPMPGGGWWFPEKLPVDDWTILPKPVDKFGKLVAEAPVRIVAYRKSNRTQERPPIGNVTYDEMHYETLLYIPYNVSYFLYVMNATWLKSVTLDIGYLTLMGMIGGTNKDRGSLLRVKWGSSATSVNNPRIINGTYSDIANIMHRDRRNSALKPSPDKYGNWTVLYNDYAGIAIFASEDFINELRSYGGRDQLWVWTSADYQRRVMEYDAIYWRGTSSDPYPTNPANKIEFKVAGFLTDGGKAVNPFVNSSLWYNGTDYNALPFKGVERPGGTIPGELVLAKRNAFIYDDFSTDPFSGRLITNTYDWSWNPSGYIEVTADGPSGSWGDAFIAYYSNTTPPVASTVYMLSKVNYATSASGQHVGLTMAESSNMLYALGFHRDANRRLAIWRYNATDPNPWYNITRTGNIGSLRDNKWFTFLGRRKVSGTGSGGMNLWVYEGSTQRGTLTATHSGIMTNMVGLFIRDENSDGKNLVARFDDFVACADANPRYVNVTNVVPGWTVRLKDSSGNVLASAVANPKGVASLDVLNTPIIVNGTIEVQDLSGNVDPNTFDVIVGGDVYRRTSAGTPKNAVEESLMYYRMFLNAYTPTIIEVKPAY